MDRSAKPIFNFVNLSHPDELKDEQTQLRIRRLAMSEVGRARRKPKTKRQKNEFVLEFRKPEAPPAAAIDRLGGGEIDPFAAYPFDMDETSRGLIAFMFRDHSVHSRQLRGAWYPVGIASKAAFYNVLSNARLYMLKELTGTYVQQDDALSLANQNKALRYMGELMKDPKTSASDDALAAISSFMCHHYILGSFAGWEIHRNAMLRIVQMRGGIDAFQQNNQLRLTLSWVDLTGSFTQDIPSAFPLPKKWLADSRSPPGSPRPFSPISRLWKQHFPMHTSWITIFDDVNQLIMLDRAFTATELQLAESTGTWMEPTMVRLLAIRPLSNGTSAEHIMEEVGRLGLMLFLAPIWRWLGASPVWSFKLTQNLLATLHSHMVEWGELKPLLVWAVYFAAVETRDQQERSQFVFVLAVLMGGMGVSEWGDLMKIVKDVMWVEHVFEGVDEGIREEVLRILRVPQRDVTPVLEGIEEEEA